MSQTWECAFNWEKNFFKYNRTENVFVFNIIYIFLIFTDISVEKTKKIVFFNINFLFFLIIEKSSMCKTSRKCHDVHLLKRQRLTYLQKIGICSNKCHCPIPFQYSPVLIHPPKKMGELSVFLYFHEWVKRDHW